MYVRGNEKDDELIESTSDRYAKTRKNRIWEKWSRNTMNNQKGTPIIPLKVSMKSDIEENDNNSIYDGDRKEYHCFRSNKRPSTRRIKHTNRSKIFPLSLHE